MPKSNQDTSYSTTWAFKVDDEGFKRLFSELELTAIDFVSYPSFEWETYGVPPPDGDLLFAWRNKQRTLFVFFLFDEHLKSHILNAVGQEFFVDKYGSKIDILRDKLANKKILNLNQKEHGDSIREFEKTNIFNNIVKIIGIPTLVFNVISASLRLFPELEIHNSKLRNLIESLIIGIHLFAYIFLLIFMGVVFYVCIKYVMRALKSI